MNAPESKVHFHEFAKLIEAIGGGEAVDECFDKLSELASAIDEEAREGRTSKGRFVFELKMDAKLTGISVSYEVKIKKPVPPRPSTFLWVSNGRFTTKNPHQMKMNLELVPNEGAEQ